MNWESRDLDVSELLWKYDRERQLQSKSKTRRAIFSDTKKKKTRGLSECISNGENLIARLSNKADRLSETLEEKSFKLSEVTSELFTWKQKFNELSIKYDKCQEK